MLIRTIVLLFSASILLACGDGSPKQITPDMVKNNATGSGDQSDKAPEMKFDTALHSFGTIVQGEKVRKTYSFTNTGNAELVITSARGSCGCTVPSYPREPIKPGEKGEIDVMFDSKGKQGKQHKKIHIVANTTPATNTVAIKGEVRAPGNE